MTVRIEGDEKYISHYELRCVTCGELVEIVRGQPAHCPCPTCGSPDGDCEKSERVTCA